MSGFKLFDFQEEALNKCLEYIKVPKQKPGIVVCPVGWGKSGLISELARLSEHPCLVLQPSATLLEQNLEKLRLLGGDATVYSASLRTKEMSKLTYATLGSIKSLGKEFKALGVKMVLIDECDGGYPPGKNSVFMSFIKDLCPDIVLGFTATPILLKAGMEGSSLKMLNRIRPKFFHNIVYCMQISEIIAKGRWTPIKYKTYEFDENAVVLNSTGAEFTEESLKRYNEVKGINNKILVEVRTLLAAGKEGILVFCDSVENAKKFSEHTQASAVVHGELSKKERKAILEGFQSGVIKVVYNFSVLGVGYDNPSLSTVIFGRATNSFRIYYQGLGRGVRLFPGKEEFLFIDFGGNVARFGEIEGVEIINHEVNGWSIFANERLLTGTPMGGSPIYKKDLIEKAQRPNVPVPDYVIDFGKHVGSKLNQIPRSYLEYLISKPSSDFSYGKMKTFYTIASKYLEDSKLLMLD
jgi:DNA repair protein RadD